MSATKHVTLWCDAEGCEEWIDHGQPTAEVTRALSKPLGWRRVREGMGWSDYCPEHSDGGET